MFKLYERRGAIWARPYVPGEDLAGVSVSEQDEPMEGGMIARNPNNERDMWYIAPEYFARNYREA